MHAYEVAQSRYVRGVALVTPFDKSPTNPTALLCNAFAGGKFSYRENGYLLNSVAFKCFVRAASLGCTSPDGARVQWESESRERFHVFSPAHCAKTLARIAREA